MRDGITARLERMAQLATDKYHADVEDRKREREVVIKKEKTTKTK
jgi:hypothetical protein